MGIEATGKLHTIFETKDVSERFRKREFVVELTDNPKYPQLVMFQLTGDRCIQLDDFAEGDQVRVEFSLRGREWRSPSGDVKYFNTLDAWKVEPVGGPRVAQRTERGGVKSGTPPVDQNVFASNDEGDIPFLSCDAAHEPSPIARVLK